VRNEEMVKVGASNTAKLTQEAGIETRIFRSPIK
jgi:hypothetical protein